MVLGPIGSSNFLSSGGLQPQTHHRKSRQLGLCSKDYCTCLGLDEPLTHQHQTILGPTMGPYVEFDQMLFPGQQRQSIKAYFYPDYLSWVKISLETDAR